MDKLLTSIVANKKCLLLSTSALAVGYVAWNVKPYKIWTKLCKPFLIYTRIKGPANLATATTCTEDFNLVLLQEISEIKSAEKQFYTGSTLEVVYDTVPPNSKDPSAQCEYQILHHPTIGSTFFRYEGAHFMLDRCEDNEVVLVTYMWNRAVLNRLLERVLDKDKKEKYENATTFWYLNSSLDWKRLGRCRRKRAMDSVILKEGLKEGLIKDIHEFLGSKEWYLGKGVPYRRGYLLYGPPGTGKTSMICALAGEIGYDISILSLSSSFLTDDDLAVALNSVYQENIVLIEDVDAAFKNRDGEDTAEGTEAVHSSSKLSFKGLLNALDGVTSQEGRIVFITTNHIKKLDSALIRPGRVDVKLLIDNPTKSQLADMFARFYPKLETVIKDQLAEELVKVWEAVTVNKKVSMACLQGLFILYKNDPNAAVKNAEEHFEQYADVDKNEFLNCYV